MQPGVMSVVPSSGPAKGGNRVTLHGYGFSHVTAVYFGSKKATIVTVGQSKTSEPGWVTVDAPAGVGTQWVTVHKGSLTNAHTPGDRYEYKS